MKIRRLLTMALLLAVPAKGSIARASDVQFVMMAKVRQFAQTNATQVFPFPDIPWHATAQIFLNPGGSLSSASVARGSILLGQLDPRPAWNFWRLAADFPSQSALNATVPEGTYTIQMFTGRDGVRTVNLSIRGENYLPPAKISNYPDTQEINPTEPFALSWNALVGATASDKIIVRVVDLPGSTESALIHQSSFPGNQAAVSATATNYLIPANTLQLGKTYVGSISSLKVSSVDTLYYPGAPAYGGYGTVTLFYLRTVASITPPVITMNPTNTTVVFGNTARFYVGASGTKPLRFQWQKNGINLPNETNSVLNLPSVSAANAGSYRVVVTNSKGSAVSAAGNLTIAAETQPPIVKITSPSAFARITNSTFKVLGTATDNIQVARIECRVENIAATPPYSVAAGTTSWTFSPSGLVAGTNIVRVRAIDVSGNISAEVTRPFIYVLTTPLSLAISGSGSVTPFSNGQRLEVGKRYTLTAKPAQGWLFAGWTGSTNATNSSLAFTMVPGLALQAVFVPNPFLQAKGSYSGLFHRPDMITLDSAGFFTASITSTGAYSGAISLEGKKHSFSGRFDPYGKAAGVISRGTSAPVSLSMQLSFADAAGTLTGSLSSTGWKADLHADQSVFNTNRPSSLAGRYTIALPGSETSSTFPAGWGYASAIVSTSGQISMSGKLGDSTNVVQKATLSSSGHWPVYVPLYGNRGLLFGWLHFDPSQPSSDVSGDLSWIRPALSGSTYYPLGFDQEVLGIGSRYTPPATRTTRVLPLTLGHATFSGLSLTTPFTNRFELTSSNKVINLQPNPFSMGVDITSGVLTGNVTTATSGKLPFRGVVLQKLNMGAGYATTPNGTTRFQLHGE